jgi:hypothetical protein
MQSCGLLFSQADRGQYEAALRMHVERPASEMNKFGQRSRKVGNKKIDFFKR